MEVQQIIKYNNRKYILDKIYPNFYLYSDMENGIRICLSEWDLKHIKEEISIKGGRPAIY